MTEEEMKNKISMELQNPITQQGFEIICKQLAEKDRQIEELKATYRKQRNKRIDELQKKSHDLEAQIEKMKCCQNCISYYKDNEHPCNIGNNENSFNHNCCDCWQLKV